MTRNREKKRGIFREGQACQFDFGQAELERVVDDLRETKRGLEATVRRFSHIYKHSPVAFMTFDKSGRIVDLNSAATRLLEITPASVLGLSFSILVSSKMCGEFLSHLRRTRMSPGSPVSSELSLQTSRGRIIPAQVVSCPVPIDGGTFFETAILDLREQRAAANEVKLARENADNIIATIPYPVFVLNDLGVIVRVNAAFLRVLETTMERALNWPCDKLPDIEWLTPDLEKSISDALRDGKLIEQMIVQARTRRGKEITLQLNAHPLPRASDQQRQLLVGFENITERRRSEQERDSLMEALRESRAILEQRVEERTLELSKTNGQLRVLGEQLVLAHESEQRRIARELHDQIGQDLTALKLMLRRTQKAAPGDSVRTLSEAVELTDDLLQTVREICGTLRPQMLDDLGLVASLEWHTKTFASRTGIQISFHAERFDESLLSPMVKTTVFRVIQEALTNVSRHAKAMSASVKLGLTDGFIEFSVQDSGKGFKADEAMQTRSTGISSMRERISLVDGKFELISSPRRGTTVSARIPVTTGNSNPIKTHDQIS